MSLTSLRSRVLILVLLLLSGCGKSRTVPVAWPALSEADEAVALAERDPAPEHLAQMRTRLETLLAGPVPSHTRRPEQVQLRLEELRDLLGTEPSPPPSAFHLVLEVLMADAGLPHVHTHDHDPHDHDHEHDAHGK